MYLRAMGAERVTNHGRAGLVIGPRRVNGGNANQPGGEVDNLIACAIDFVDHAIDGRVVHSVIV